MCYVCLHLAFEATLFLGREGHAMHTLGEAMGEAIVLIYSFLVPMEDGWILKLGSVCVLSHFICVQLFATPWTVALPGFSVHGILQARILEWVAMPFSKGSS